ncbi:LytR/AlgR family response regulator transcription factor [Taibaiella chishuiensis]|uniref:LytTR family two component transcriptional regulator n=1 Tax=Taibaiella chishuiensis TaxID=1434707 RepID=A0A2P8D086_9BACT|nr:LytTR family DNA-binding domain-containing protein [Taibaiella chishuiensis]PSK90621.1 LytTR family two component transcriptional regulator [Taibaiella chishuiensis]
MNIIIIEDEAPAFNRLGKMIKELLPAAAIGPQLDSIKAAQQWFAFNDAPDLLFLDINLADGSSFDLLKLIKIDCPIIFTTAYDQYALEAFKVSSIDYLLKPVKREDLQGAFYKLRQFKGIFKSATAADPGPAKEFKKRFVVRFGEHIKTLNSEDIAYFFSESKATFARLNDGRTFPVDFNLDALEDLLDPALFFRINRQFLISLPAIAEMKTYSKARVIVTLQPQSREQPVVSSERSAQFKHWLDGEL